MNPGIQFHEQILQRTTLEPNQWTGGAEINGPGDELLPGIRSCALKSITAKRLDENFWMHETGAGKVYFGSFFDYPSDFALVARITDLLKTIGENVRAASPFQVETSSPYMHYSVWEHHGKKKMYVVDADWRKLKGGLGTALTVRDGNRVQRINVKPGELVVVT